MLTGACLVWFSAALFSADPDPRELFQRAQILAERNQDLPEAIRLYGQVVQFARSQQTLAAEAQYRQGLLYERIGKKQEAEQSFRAVIRSFPNTRSASLAKAKLPNGGVAAEMRTRRIWYGAGLDPWVAPSPDGRLLSFVDWTSGDLAVHDVTTGENRRVTHNQNGPATALYSVFSADGKRLAYSWFPGTGAWEIRLIGLRSSQPRVLYRAPAEHRIRVVDWSADGKYILADLSLRQLSSSMLLVSLADGSSRILPTTGCVCGSMRFSRDSRFIAYEAVASGETRRQISAISMTGDRAFSVVQDPAADDALLGWAPDGKHLIFASDRSGTRDIWSIAVSDGKALSAAERLLSVTDTGEPLGITRDGTLFYARAADQSDIYIADIDLRDAKFVGQPRLASQRYVGNKTAPAWSPDGKLLAYTVGGPPRIIIVDSQTGQERELIPQLAYVTRILAWHPDGRFRVQGKAADGPVGFYALDSETGAATLLASDINDRPAFSEDGRTIYWGRWGLSGRDPGIFAQDLATGDRKVLYRPSDPATTKNPSTALSPDSNWLAIVLQNLSPGTNSLAVLPAAGGEPRVLISERDCCGGRSLNWTPDSQRILYSRPGSGIWMVDRNGGIPKKMGIESAGPAVKLSPDGKQVAFEDGASGEEIWVLENFLGRN